MGRSHWGRIFPLNIASNGADFTFRRGKVTPAPGARGTPPRLPALSRFAVNQGTRDMTSIYDAIQEDHQTHRTLLNQIAETSGDSEERRKAWKAQ